MTSNYGLTASGVLIKLFSKDKDIGYNFPTKLLTEVKKLYIIFMEKEILIVKSLNIFSDIIKVLNDYVKYIQIYTSLKGFVTKKEEADYSLTQGYRRVKSI